MNEYCIESIPYASTIGFILLLFGCGVFSGTVWTGSDRTAKFFQDHFYSISEPSYLQKASLTYATITLIVGLVILIYGISVTGNTRKKLYKSMNAINSNNSHSKYNLSKTAAGLLLGFCYVLFAGWLVICGIGAATVTLWMMISSVCKNEMDYWHNLKTNKDEQRFTYSFNLSNYGVYPSSKMNVKTYIDKSEDMQKMCEELATVGPLFTVGFICSSLVLVSLLTLISALAANLVRLKYLPEITKFHQIAAASLGDGDITGASSIGPPGHLSMATHSTFDPQTTPYYLGNSSYGGPGVMGPTQMELQPLNQVQNQPSSQNHQYIHNPNRYTSQPNQYYQQNVNNNNGGNTSVV